jgi:hypothetical protein
MADETNFEVSLHAKVTSDDGKLAEVANDLDKVNKKLEENAQASAKAGQEEKSWHEQAKEYAEAHAGALGMLAVAAAGMAAALALIKVEWNELKEGTKEALAQDRALGQLRNTVASYGGDAKEASEATGALARQLEGVGFKELEIVKATQRLTVVTGDHAVALSAASLAADISIKRGMEYGAALTIIQRLLTDSPRGLITAQQQLGIQATSSAEALAKIDAKFRGSAASVDDATARINKSTMMMKDGFRDAGAVIGSVLGGVSQLFSSYVQRTTENQIEIEYRFRKMIGSTADADAWYANALKKWKEKFGLPLGEAFAKLAVIGDHSLTSPAALEELGKKTASDMKQLMKDVDAEVAKQKKEDHEAELKAEAAQRRANDNADAAAAEQKRIDDVQLKIEENSRATRLARIKKAAHDEAEVQKQVQKTLNADLKKMDEQRVTDFVISLRDMLLHTKMSTEDREALEYKLSEAERAMDAAVAKTKIDSEVYAAQQATSIATDLFGKNKGVQIAAATVNTIAAAVGAFNDTPGSIYERLAAMAVALAAGYAQVKNIEGTDIGSGGGGGTSAMGGAAVYGGTSISTPVPTIQNSSVQNSTNVRGGDTYVINSVVGSAAVAQTMQLQKALRPGSRAYDRTIASRQPVTAGTVRRG